MIDWLVYYSVRFYRLATKYDTNSVDFPIRPLSPTVNSVWLDVGNPNPVRQ